MCTFFENFAEFLYILEITIEYTIASILYLLLNIPIVLMRDLEQIFTLCPLLLNHSLNSLTK